MFQRLLVGKQDRKQFILTNPGVLPESWQLVGVEGLPPELVVFPVSGRLEARSEVGTVAG